MPSLPDSGLRVAGTGAYLPARVLSNHDLEKLVETTDEWIFTRTGIKERRIASEKETSTFMGGGCPSGARRSENPGHGSGSHSRRHGHPRIFSLHRLPDLRRTWRLGVSRPRCPGGLFRLACRPDSRQPVSFNRNRKKHPHH